MDDYPPDGHITPLIPYIDIVKVDWLKTPLQLCRQLADELIPKGIKLLAEKVETHGLHAALLARATYSTAVLDIRSGLPSR